MQFASWMGQVSKSSYLRQRTTCEWRRLPNWNRK